MDYRQFMRLMEPGVEPIKDSISTLQEFVKEFPFFQSAQAMLAKSMYDQQHVRYEKQLKVAAAYAGDRKLLYDLIQTKKIKIFDEEISKTDSPFKSTSISEVAESENIFKEQLIEPVFSDLDEENVVDIPAMNPIDIKPPVTFYKEENEIETNYYDERPVEDPHDIIRRRLVEILGLKEENTISDEIISEERNVSKKDAIEQLIEESAKAVDFIQKAEIEYALESTLIHSLEKLPIIENQNVNEKLTQQMENLGNSFYDWLKIKTFPGYGKIEEVHAYPIEKELTSAGIGLDSEQRKEVVVELKTRDLNQLIDRFIKSDPKIVPSKTEFYSPVTQAKKSITENEDVVSETLAKIYHQQGNFLKARSSYQKLSLLYPEKLAYFAALISELDKTINNLDKQDL